METEAEVFRNSSDWLTLSLKSKVKIKRFNEAEKEKLQQVENIDNSVLWLLTYNSSVWHKVWNFWQMPPWWKITNWRLQRGNLRCSNRTFDAPVFWPVIDPETFFSCFRERWTPPSAGIAIVMMKLVTHKILYNSSTCICILIFQNHFQTLKIKCSVDICEN